MPHFEDFYADKLRGALGVADADAGWICATPRGRRLRRRFRTCWNAAVSATPRRRDSSLAAAEGGGENLFQPIGKALLEAKKRGWIDRLQTLPAQDGLGFYVALAGRPARPDERALADGTRAPKQTRRNPPAAGCHPTRDKSESRRQRTFLGDRNRRLEIAVSRSITSASPSRTMRATRPKGPASSIAWRSAPAGQAARHSPAWPSPDGSRDRPHCRADA